jgi:ribonuclease HI
VADGNIIELFSDGACKGNPGLGGWGVLIKNSKTLHELKGTQQQTTNNRMELIAVIEGLRSIKEHAHIEITTDSMYVKNGINQWINNWKKKWMENCRKKASKKQRFMEGIR